MTGIVISTLFPVHKDTYPKDILYDIENDLVYCICSNGEIAVYHSNTSPGRIIRVWDPDVKITSSCVVTFTLEKSNTPYLSIVAGTTDGQLVLLDTAQNGRRDNLVQVLT